MESFIKEQMAKANATIEAQRKEHQEQLDRQLKIINNLRQENSEHLKELEITKSDNKKLTDNNNALTTIISNVLSYIRDNQSTYSKYLQDENIPKLDSYDLFSINNYFNKLMPVLLGAIPSFRFHQARSIDLGTTEQCKGYENANDTPDDDVAREDGAHDLESAAEVHVEKQDELADEELTVAKDITLKGDKNSSCSKASEPFCNCLLEIFERRKGLSTVMCTLYEQSEWHNRLGGNVQAESVIDRIVHNCVDIVLGDLNMRAYTSPTKMK